MSTTDRDLAGELGLTDDPFADPFEGLDDGGGGGDDDAPASDRPATWLDDVESDLIAHEVGTDGADDDSDDVESTDVADVATDTELDDGGGPNADGADLDPPVVDESSERTAVVGLLDGPEARAPSRETTDVVEALRRSDVDGPLVPFAPQDDTSSGIRRPKRRPDFDPAPVPVAPPVPRVLGRRPRVRKVTRVVRHVDPWSVFKIAIVANLVLYVIGLVAGVLLWNVAYATGTIDNVERFLESFGWSSFEFKGGEIFHNGWIAGLFMVIGLTGLAVLLATLFNLITDLVGGMRLTVLEEEVVESRTSPMRRFVIRRPEPDVPLVIDDGDGTGPIYREAVVDDSGAIDRPAR